MDIVLATGIYPPDIGGTATYAESLAKELRKLGNTVSIITYGKANGIEVRNQVVTVSKEGGMFKRWKRYREAVKTYASNADAIIAFSSVSVGMPLMQKLKKPKKVLRLGGEFFWERYTDAGGMKSLAAWHRSRFGFWRFMDHLFMEAILKSFNSVVYSTKFQSDLHEKRYSLKKTAIIENAFPDSSYIKHIAHRPFKLLCVSRFVGFKNLPTLISALKDLPEVRLTLVGSGPLEEQLKEQAKSLGLESKVTFISAVSSEKKFALFAEHDALIIPSVTDISPNTALEARAHGLPVILTSENGLSAELSSGMLVTSLQRKSDMKAGIHLLMQEYSRWAASASSPSPERSWKMVAEEWHNYLKTL